MWPDIRVREANKDGLDALAITGASRVPAASSRHSPSRRNRALEVAQRYLERQTRNGEPGTETLILIAGSEITRGLPPGHANAVFIEDANPLLSPNISRLRTMAPEEALADALTVFETAKDQGAFIFWNHPHWVGQQPDGIATLTDTHRQLIENGQLHGVEVINDITYSPRSPCYCARA